MEILYAGLDIGGQSIKGIILDEAGNVRCEASRVTQASRGAKAVLEAIRSLVDELSVIGAVSAVGVGTPGGVDRDGVIVGMAANISGWYGTRLGDEISAMAFAPCSVRNDGDIAAYAEWAVRLGRSRGTLFIGLGTGIGGGYIEDGRIMGGCDDRAVEIGHIIIEPSGRRCACGIDGCSEAYASGPSIGRVATALGRGEDAGLGSLARAAYPNLDFADSPLAARALAGECFNAREVYEAYAAGDRLALAVDAITAEALARAVSIALAMLAPDTVVFGGGVIVGAPHLPARVAQLMPAHVYRDAWNHCGFETALLSHRAGLLGAAFYGASLVAGRSELFALAAGALKSNQAGVQAQ
ncbi:MAG TPA: ROK family protein [Rectinemataceae bacterium]|nr:ROK family protein [Rectinemataceae bacterium]